MKLKAKLSVLPYLKTNKQSVAIDKIRELLTKHCSKEPSHFHEKRHDKN